MLSGIIFLMDSDEGKSKTKKIRYIFIISTVILFCLYITFFLFTYFFNGDNHIDDDTTTVLVIGYDFQNNIFSACTTSGIENAIEFAKSPKVNKLIFATGPNAELNITQKNELYTYVKNNISKQDFEFRIEDSQTNLESLIKTTKTYLNKKDKLLVISLPFQLFQIANITQDNGIKYEIERTNSKVCEELDTTSKIFYANVAVWSYLDYVFNSKILPNK